MKYSLVVFFILFQSMTGFSKDISSVTAFKNANVVSMESETVQKNCTVLVQNGRIVAIGPTTQVNVPQSAKLIDASGKYLIPGLVDAHAHVSFPEDLTLYIASGVTTIQGLGGNPPLNDKWIKDLDENKVVGPNYVQCDSIAEAFNTPEEGRSFVKQTADRGRKCIKLYSPPDWTKEIYVAVLEEAKTRGIRRVGHLPRNLDIETALSTGLQSVAHGEEYLYTYFNKLKNRRNPDDIPYVVRLTKENKVSVIPNLVAYHAIGLQSGDELQELLKDPGLQYMPLTVRENWAPPFNRYRNQFDAEAVKRLRINHGFLQKMTLEMEKAGVTLAVGTDSARHMPFVLPGYSALQELEEMVTAGLTPYQALRSGTAGGAIALNAPEEFGQIKKGMRADLVLLEANPLQDIRNVRRQTGVMVRGQWFDKKDIEAFLKEHIKTIRIYDDFISAVLRAGIDGDLDQAKTLYTKLKFPLLEDANLNSLTYEFLNVREDPVGAIALSRMNVHLFPDSWVVNDTLAEAYMKANKDDLAISFYKKSLELNKKNSNAEAMLKKLQSSQ